MKTSLNMKLKQSTYAVMTAIAVLAAPQMAQAGAGFADNIDKAGTPFKQPTFYANSPSGVLAAHGPAGSTAPEGTTRDTGTALRKFVDNLPLIPGYVNNTALLNANAIGATGRVIPLAVKEVTPAAGGHSTSYPDADYYEIAVVEYREQLHSDLPPVVSTPATVAGQGPVVTGGTTLRGYVQIWTPNLPASTVKTQLFYLNGNPVKDNQGNLVYIVGNQPHYLGPVIDSQKGTPVRIRFDNYLPTGHYDPITKTRGGDIFLPTDTTIAGSGLGPNGAQDPTAPNAYDMYTQNRVNMYLQGADNPWISDGNPNSWITPAGENTQYPAGVITQNVPDMPSPGAGAQTLYYPNNQSAKMSWLHDYTSGSARMNIYAGIMSAFMIHDAAEATLKAAGGALNGMDEIPLIFEDKTFVPKDIAVQDAKWSTTAWGQYGDLWFPHVYETNQNPDAIDGLNPPGRWDYGPWFWPIFPAPLALPNGSYGNASVTLESIHDTPVINGIAYPNLNVEPKAYRFRMINAANTRVLNLGFYVAAPIAVGVSAAGYNYAQPAVAATATTAAVAGTSVTISADDNGLFPTATAVVAPIPAPVVTMVTGGTGYSATTTATFSGGGAVTQATGTPVITGGVITGVTITNPGSGYNTAVSGPVTVTFTDPAATGAGATATVTAAVGGQITAVMLNPPPAGVTYVYNVNKPTASVVDATGAGTGATLLASANTEVPMIPAAPPAGNAAYDPATYDGRPGGLPDPAAAGPNIIEIGNEAGFLAQPNVIPSTPVAYDPLRRIVTVYNILVHGLYVGPGENSDFVVDFSQFAGKTLIVYNDAPAPDPLLDPRYDYYTGDVDQTNIGGGDVTLPGYGPNTRTIMRVNVAATQFSGAAPAAPYDELGTGGPLATAIPAAFAAGQDVPPVPFSWQNAAYGSSYQDHTAHIYVGSLQQPGYTFSTGGAQTITGFRIDSVGHEYTVPPNVEFIGGLAAGGTPATAHAVLDQAGLRVDSIVLDTPGSGYTSEPVIVLSGGDGNGASASALMSNTQNLPVYGKGIQELFDFYYGRMNATFSAELPFLNSLVATTIPVGSIDPPTELIQDGETQIWKITHNGVATHQVTFHQFDVQVVNRVAWDGTIRAQRASESGWKQTIKMDPLEDVYLAVRPKPVLVPFGVPQSIHALDVTQPIGGTMGFSQINPLTGVSTTVTNQVYNYDWEYVWHNALLGNDAIDFRRPIVEAYGTIAPAAVAGVSYNPATQTVTWTDPTPAATAAGNKANETGFLILRTDTGTFPTVSGTPPQSAAQAALNPSGYLSNVVAANVTTWTDPVPASSTTQYCVLAFNAVGYSPSFVATTAGTGVAGTASTALVTTGAATSIKPGAPAAPVNVRGSLGAYIPATGGFPVTLTWSAVSQPKNGFQILRQGGIQSGGGPVADVTFLVPATQVAVNGVYTFVDSTATELSGYTYTVTGDNGTSAVPLLGAGSTTQVFTSFGTPPAVAGLTAVSADSGNSVQLNWTVPAAITPDPNVTATNHITAYRVVRTTNGAITAVMGVRESQNAVSGAITPPDTAIKDTAPIAGVASVYTVYGVNGNLIGTSTVASSSATFTPTAALAPGLSGLTGTATSATSITLNWAPAPAGSTVTGFVITRTSGATITTVYSGTNPNITTYTDTTVSQNTPYTYSVQWVNGANLGLAASTPSITTPYGAATPVTLLSGLANTAATAVNLSWTSGGASTAYDVSRCVNVVGNATCSGAYALLASGITTTTYTDSSVVNGTGYTYQVIARNGPVNLSAPVTTPVLDVTAPQAPAIVNNTIASGSVTVTWTASPTAATTGYVVQRSADNGVTWTTLSTVAGINTLTYTDATPVIGNTYLYRIESQEAVTGYPVITGTPSTTTSAVYKVQNAPVLTYTAPIFGGTATAPTEAIYWSETALAGAPAVTGYQVFRNGVLLATTTALSYTDTTAAPGSSYTYNVYATNLLGNSAASANLVSDLLTQPAPTAVKATFVNNVTSTVSWTLPVADTQAPAISAYQVWGTTTSAAGVVTGPALVATAGVGATSIGVPEATGNTYTYTVRSVNLIGTGVDSATSATIADVVPAAPTAPTLTYVNSTSVKLAWTAATVVANAPAVTSYQIFASLNGGASGLYATVTAPTTTYTAPVAVGTAYSFTIVAVNGAGSSVASTAVAISDTVPTAPTALAVAPVSATQAALSWTASTVAANAQAITGYNVYNNGVKVTTTPLAATATSYTATVSSGTTYGFTVQAVNAVGSSVASNLVYYADSAPNAPTGVTVSGATSSTVNVNWTLSTDPVYAPAITGYNVYNGTTLLNATPLSPTTTTFSVPTTLGTTYSFTVKAINGVNLSTASTAVAFSASVPTAPTTPAAAFLSSTSATVSWKAATVAANAPAITAYNVLNNGVVVATAASTATSVAVTGLTVGTTYSFTVVAVNGEGSSAASTAVTYANTVPNAPTGVTTAPVSATSVKVSWTAATVTATSQPVKSYSLYNGTTLLQSGITGTTVTLTTGITAGTTYAFNVVAVSNNGNSLPSASVTYADSVPTAPAAPTLGTVTRNAPTTTSTTDTVVINWAAVAAPAGQTVTYKVDYSTTAAFTTVTSVTGITGTTTTFTAVARGTAAATPTSTAYFRVTAVDTVGSSVASATLTVAPASLK